MDKQTNDIPRIPSISDREYYRVDGKLYLHCEPIEYDQNNKNDSQGFFIPTFVQEEDDLVGLSIDAFREQLLHEKFAHQEYKEYFLKIQQLMAMMKRCFDAEVLGRKQKIYNKVKVNISGSGVAFPSEIAYNSGQLLRLCLYFPRFPFTYVSVVGEVVRSEKADVGYEIKLQFKDISEKTQDEILRFVNQCQRDHINQEEDSPSDTPDDPS